jgi:hypothetical protein
MDCDFSTFSADLREFFESESAIFPEKTAQNRENRSENGIFGPKNAISGEKNGIFGPEMPFFGEKWTENAEFSGLKTADWENVFALAAVFSIEKGKSRWFFLWVLCFFYVFFVVFFMFFFVFLMVF